MVGDMVVIRRGDGRCLMMGRLFALRAGLRRGLMYDRQCGLPVAATLWPTSY